VITTGLVTRIELPSNHEIAASVFLSALVLVIYGLVYSHIENQLEMKDLGGANVAAALWFMNQALNENFSKSEMDDILKIKAVAEDQAQAKIILPSKFIDKANQLNTRARGFQDKTRNLIYGLMLIFSLFSLSSLWINVGC